MSMNPTVPDNGHAAAGKIANSRPYRRDPTDPSDNVSGGFTQPHFRKGEAHDRDEWVRTAAYFLWEEAGRPDGQQDRYWAQALEQYERQLESDALLRMGSASP